jgi:N-acetylated-alpha-linked acidic dipeptidase
MRYRLVLVFLIVIVLGGAGARAQDKPLLGFTPENAAKERALEAKFDGLLNAQNLRDWMKRLSAKPHHVGSDYGRENAEFIAARFREWGFQTEIERFYVLFPTPKTRVLEMTGPKRFRATLQEPRLKEDATSGIAGQLPIYNAYSIDGDVTAPLVYVNYGVPKDYETLEAEGIDVKGKIVIARYGGSWRGIKPKVAAEHGAVGCLIYSDPRDDGYFQGDTYPKGAYRNAQGAQRGSVADMPLFPGDPLTPGVGATKDAVRLARKDAPTLTRIPVLPISYADAQPLLESLGGPVAPADWRGALPLTYHLGPGPSTVHLKLTFDWNTVECRDVIAKLPGAERPDEWVIRGNHHDAWVFGADDPLSGTVALMEEARAVGEMAKGGWKPKRTLVYCAWDGEEPGLLGSTEWAETHADELSRVAAVYINSDSNGRGFLGVGGSHTLERFVGEVAGDVTDPETKIPVGQRLRALRLVSGSPEDKERAKSGVDLSISALGSGSDYTPFLQHLGIATLNLGYGGENGGGSYHSAFDSFDWYVRFGDPQFAYGIALAQTAGRMMLRLGDADVLPFNFTPLSSTLDRYLKELTKQAGTMREETDETNRMIADGTVGYTLDPTLPDRPPKPKAAVPFLNFAPLQNALLKLQASARTYDDERSRTAADPKLSDEQAKALDILLIQAERAMTRSEGLPRRPWFRHQFYAPGFYTGYGVKTLPGVREALEQRDWQEMDSQMTLLAQTVEAVAAQIDRATEALRGSHGR